MTDIILITHNNILRTVDCITALYQFTSDFRLTVVDDSTDLTKDWLLEYSKKVPNLDLVRPEIKLLEGSQIFNIGLEKAKSEFVVLMTSTTTVEPDWLPPLLKVMEGIKDCAVVQPKHLFPQGTIENAGIYFREPLMHHQNYGVGEPAHRWTHIREVDGAGFCCVLVRREAIYPLDTGYYIGFRGFDDVDTCMSLRKKGWKTIYCGYSTTFHYAHDTRENTEKSWKEYDENRFRFLTRWCKWGEFKKEVE